MVRETGLFHHYGAHEALMTSQVGVDVSGVDLSD